MGMFSVNCGVPSCIVTGLGRTSKSILGEECKSLGKILFVRREFFRMHIELIEGDLLLFLLYRRRKKT